MDEDYLTKKTILVTGGGGSIGSELCRQIATLHAKQLLILDRSEYNLYCMDMELKKNFPQTTIHSILMDITDPAGLEKIFSHFHPNVIFHTAAYKHVPLLEEQARVAIFNNVLGTQHLAQAALIHGIEKFVLISTDKAVNPTNVMGATKRASEIICQSYHNQSVTQFITVRFGNVVDSAGSVVPLFKKQIQEGGPVTVTHPEIARYFMSITEAVQLIIQATLLGKGGEIFVLDMGDPVKIRDLAEQLIILAGKKVSRDIEIVYTGLRPGEKLYEELFYANEALQVTIHNKIMQAKVSDIDRHLLQSLIEELANFYYLCDEERMCELLYQIVPEYQHNNERRNKCAKECAA